jgi:ATP-binding cassette subfamily G (WHITE) protein 1
MERPVFLREVNNNMYTVSAYFWSKIFSELPMSVLMPTLQAVIVYFALGLNTEVWYKFLVFMTTSILCYNAFTGFGYILGTSISNKQVAVILTPVLIVPTMLFAGFFVNQDNIPIFLRPLREIAIFKYAYQAYMINEFTDLNLDCMTNPDPFMSCDPLGDFNSPQTLEQSLYIMAIIWFVFYFIAFIIMMKMSRKYEA